MASRDSGIDVALMRDQAAPALSVAGVSKTFPGQKALDDINFDVQAGHVHAVLGENGSGKSTLIKILAGIYLPDPGGDVLVGGQRLPLGSPAASSQLGLRFVHQRLGVIGELNAVENMALEAGFVRPRFIDWTEQAKLTRRLLARLEASFDIWKPLRDCRPVERSAVAIARALWAGSARSETAGDEVTVVALDEPTASLPAPEVRQLFGAIKDLCVSGIAVIYVSHRLDEVFQIADRVTVLRDGRLQATEHMGTVSRERLIQLIAGRAITQGWRRLARDRGGKPDGDALTVRGLSADVIRDLSFSVGKGEIVGAVGVTGSGREILARTIVGATPADDGEVIVAGTDLGSVTPGAALKAGLVLALGNTQPSSATAALTIGENLSFAALRRYTKWGRLSTQRQARDVGEWIERLDIRPRDPDRLYRLMSGGNQQKVILGKWLNASPAVLILDEPTGGVDVGARRAIYELLAAEASRGLAVLLCSSDLEDIVSLCDRVIVFRDGRVVTTASGDAITEQNLLLWSVGREDEVESPVNE